MPNDNNDDEYLLNIPDASPSSETSQKSLNTKYKIKTIKPLLQLFFRDA